MTLTSLARYDHERVSQVGTKAVVVGSSISGLVAARVLADGFDEVTVFERDSLPDEPRPRRGVPQASHSHVLLEAGRSTLSDLFPGYVEDVVADGGLVIDYLSDMHFYAEGGFLATGPKQIPMLSASRPLFEQHVRHRVAELESVTIQSGSHVTDYRTSAGGTAVTGVNVREVGNGHEESVDADLVVDASGRTSKTPRWLETNGYTAPQVDEVTVDVAYSTTVVERPPDDRRAFVLIPAPPLGRGCFVFPVEGGRWLVTMSGAHGDHPPTDRDEFVEFAGTLPFDEPHTLLENNRWIADDIAHHPFPSNRRHRYEKLDRFPDGLVVLGDALTSFNPVYGQGMSVGTLEALALHHALAAGTDDLADRFFDRVADVIDPAWRLAAGTDFQFDETGGPRPLGTRAINWYLNRLQRSARTDGQLHLTFGRVVTMQESPTTLFRPGVLWRVFGPTG